MDRVAWWTAVHRIMTEATSHIIPIVQIQRYEMIITGDFSFSFFSFYGINVNSYHKDNKIIHSFITYGCLVRTLYFVSVELLKIGMI